MDATDAQSLHELAQLTSPGHDTVRCWCCCTDCKFDYDEIMQVTNARKRLADSR